MKNLLLAVLLAFCQAVSAQTIDDLVDKKIKAAEARQKAYADSLFKAKGDNGPVDPKPDPDPDTRQECAKIGRDPKILSISNAKTTSLALQFDANNVFELQYVIFGANGDSLYSNTKKPSSAIVELGYNPLSNGSYTLKIRGYSCKSPDDSKTFEIKTDQGGWVPTDPSGPPSTSKGKRSIIMNLTGYGFNANEATGIDAKWQERIEAFLNMNYNGKKFRGIDAIRVNMKWRDYEPKEGTFRDDKILDMINYCKQRDLKLCIAFIPWRTIGDGMFVEYDMQKQLPDRSIWIEEGSLPSTIRTYMPSFHSAKAQTKFRAAVRHLAAIMAQYPDNVDYISTATSGGEEYETVIEKGPNGQIYLTGYGDADLEAWRSYSGGLAVPYPAQHNEEHIAYLFSSDIGKKWYEFRTKGLKDFHAAFVRGVREGGGGTVRSLGMYAGVGAPSGTWTGLYKLNDVFSAGTADQPDIIYSSEGDAGSQSSKLMATDLNKGTFPGAALAIEFDPDDVSVLQDRKPAGNVSSDILLYWAVPFFERDGEDLHFAMSFETYQINQLAKAIWYLRAQFIDSDAGMTGIAQGDHFTFPITRYSGLQEYREMYGQRGGGIKKQVKITLK